MGILITLNKNSFYTYIR